MGDVGQRQLRCNGPQCNWGGGAFLRVLWSAVVGVLERLFHSEAFSGSWLPMRFALRRDLNKGP